MNKTRKQMKVYISLPITGKDIEEQKRHAESVAGWLMAAGHTVVVPFDNGLKADASYEDHLREDTKMLLGCDAVFMCKGWHLSCGCTFEHEVAVKCGLTVVTEYMPIDKILLKLNVGKIGRPASYSSCKDFDKSHGYCNNFAMPTSKDFCCRFFQEEVCE